MDYSKIEPLLAERGIAKNSFSRIVGKSRHGFNQMISKQTMNVKTLEVISKELAVPLSFWWNEDELFPERKEIEELKKKIEYLERLNMNLLEQNEELKSKHDCKSKHAC